ncbi:MAG: hypothetical protein II932_05475, partial [Treponema sp.]|nr:hypothetical protein [Treponema sp.]
DSQVASDGLSLTYDTTGLPEGTTVEWTVQGTPGMLVSKPGADVSISYSSFLGPLGPGDGGMWAVSVTCKLKLPMPGETPPELTDTYSLNFTAISTGGD